MADKLFKTKARRPALALAEAIQKQISKEELIGILRFDRPGRAPAIPIKVRAGRMGRCGTSSWRTSRADRMLGEAPERFRIQRWRGAASVSTRRRCPSATTDAGLWSARAENKYARERTPTRGALRQKKIDSGVCNAAAHTVAA